MSNIGEVYDILCEKADDLFRKHDLCGTAIGDGKCHGNRFPEKTGRDDDRCCKDCDNLIPGEGCSVKSLCCKIWLCGTVAIMASKDPQLQKAIEELRAFHRECYEKGLPVGAGIVLRENTKSRIVSIGFRKGKEETLSDIKHLRNKGKIP